MFCLPTPAQAGLEVPIVKGPQAFQASAAVPDMDRRQGHAVEGVGFVPQPSRALSGKSLFFRTKSPCSYKLFYLIYTIFSEKLPFYVWVLENVTKLG